MANLSNFRTEIESFLKKLNALSEPYRDPVTEREYLRIANSNVVLHFNAIAQNAGEENPRLTAYFAGLGMNLVQLWEDQWHCHTETVKSRLESLAGKSIRIHARNTVVEKITNPILVNFLKKNHLNLPLKGKHKYGLFLKDRLVSVASFSYPRNITYQGTKVKSFELLRFCHLNGHSVTGGLTKLMAHFFREINPDHLMTYIDKEWGPGEGFEKAGFVVTGSLPPKAFWIHRETFTRNYNPPSNEYDKFIQVFNSGSIKMEKIFVRK